MILLLQKDAILGRFWEPPKITKIENSNISKDVEQKMKISMFFGWVPQG